MLFLAFSLHIFIAFLTALPPGRYYISQQQQQQQYAPHLTQFIPRPKTPQPSRVVTPPPAPELLDDYNKENDLLRERDPEDLFDWSQPMDRLRHNWRIHHLQQKAKRLPTIPEEVDSSFEDDEELEEPEQENILGRFGSEIEIEPDHDSDFDRFQVSTDSSNGNQEGEEEDSESSFSSDLNDIFREVYGSEPNSEDDLESAYWNLDFHPHLNDLEDDEEAMKERYRNTIASHPLYDISESGSDSSSSSL